MRIETLEKFQHWQKMLKRGRQKVRKLSKNPEGRAELLAESQQPGILMTPHLAEESTSAEKVPGPDWLWEREQAGKQIHAGSPRDANTRRYAFLSFPPEVRNMIYRGCADYPDCRRLFDAYYTQKTKSEKTIGKEIHGQFTLQLHTPTILLLCKQITRESLGILRSRAFVLDRLPPWIMDYPNPLTITNFISKPTLQQLQHIEVRLSLGDSQYGSCRVWMKVLKDLLRTLSGQNSVVGMKVMIKLNNVATNYIWTLELPDYEHLIKLLHRWEVHHARKPGTVQFEHWIMEHIYAFRIGHRNPAVRIYPDPYLWTGSILEYL